MQAKYVNNIYTLFKLYSCTLLKIWLLQVSYPNVCVHSTDIEPKSSDSAPVTVKADKPLWSHSDNTFRFNFLPDNSPALQKETSPPSDRTGPGQSRIPFTGQGSAFAFNFQIPPVTPVEHMETTETPGTSSPDSQQGVQEEKPSPPQGVSSPPEASVQSKAKKKKPGKKKPSDNTEPQQKPSFAEGNQGGEDTKLVSVKGFPLK